MAHIKTVSPYGWDFDDRVAAPLKLGADGRFGPNDRREFVKRASQASHAFLPMIENGTVKFAADEVPVHLIALGAKEAYGPNRNGDGFMEAALKEAHDTFVKYALWFRNHKNKPHEGHPSYGLVKASAYNQQMRRVELLVALASTKKAADRMGVTGPADREIEKLARDEDIPVSMACRVPYDVCSGCGNKARNRDEYCKAASCKYGGCYDNLTRLVKTANDVHLLHVNNPNPCFFDISNVFRPADRIAYAGKADWMSKAASDGWDGRYAAHDVYGVKAAGDLEVEAPMSVVLAQAAMTHGDWTPAMAQTVKVAYGLAALEQQPEKWATAETRRAFAADVQPPADLAALECDGEPTREKVATALGALAAHKIVLPLRDFARMTKRAGLAEPAAARLPGVYGRMVHDGTLEARLGANPYAPSEKLASLKQRTAAGRMAATHSLEKEAVDTRCLRSAVRGCPVPALKTTFETEKTAGDRTGAEELARDYACYKAAALRKIAETDGLFPLTARLALSQNQVI